MNLARAGGAVHNSTDSNIQSTKILWSSISISVERVIRGCPNIFQLYKRMARDHCIPIACPLTTSYGNHQIVSGPDVTAKVRQEIPIWSSSVSWDSEWLGDLTKILTVSHKRKGSSDFKCCILYKEWKQANMLTSGVKKWILTLTFSI